MAKIQKFEEIEAWQKARQLTKEIYRASSNNSFARDFALRDQIRRAGNSVMSNIAEGFERGGNKEFIQFLSVAKGSASEVKSHLYLALDQGYIEEDAFKGLYSLTDEIVRMTGALSGYLCKSDLKGHKYK